MVKEDVTLEQVMQTKVFSADAHTKGDTLADVVTVGKALELHVSRYWE